MVLLLSTFSSQHWILIYMFAVWLHWWVRSPSGGTINFYVHERQQYTGRLLYSRLKPLKAVLLLWFILIVNVCPPTVCYCLIVHFIKYTFVAICWERTVLLAFHSCCFYFYGVVLYMFLSRLVFRAGCGIRLYRFLIIVFSSTLHPAKAMPFLRLRFSAQSLGRGGELWGLIVGHPKALAIVGYDVPFLSMTAFVLTNTSVCLAKNKWEVLGVPQSQATANTWHQ